LVDLTEKLKEDSKKELELHHQQMTKRNQKWKEHMDSETTAFAAWVEQERQTLEATTNQEIKSYEAMNKQLRFENEAIKACCDSQAVQQTVMQQQITELLAHQNIRQNQFTPDHPMDYDHKHDAPATPTTMSNSPGQAFKKATTDITPKNLLETLTKAKTIKRNTDHWHDRAAWQQSTKLPKASPTIYLDTNQPHLQPPVQKSRLEATRSSLN
jgi:hypothetical protein